MDKIKVSKSEKKSLLKLKKQLAEAYRTWHLLSDELQEDLTVACGGDSIGSCIHRGSDLADEICDNLHTEK